MPPFPPNHNMKTVLTVSILFALSLWGLCAAFDYFHAASVASARAQESAVEQVLDGFERK